ncbi:MAG: YkgJ family cysteine cluster protein [Deltaproteobacteria bacterium]|jgi:Fe-S-cluster containining protein|nr:YkgJ family cysteine cluster protein [Deltaproteobacteria bacterium]
MKIDIDRPSTWKKFKTSTQCESCFAGCCTMPVEVKIEDLIRLDLTDKDEVENLGIKRVTKKLIKEKKIIYFREATGLFMLMQKANKDCIFLDLKSRKCTVYSKRPDVCRNFPDEGPRPGFCPQELKKI